MLGFQKYNKRSNIANVINQTSRFISVLNVSAQMIGLPVIALFAVVTAFLYPFIMSEAQRPGSSTATDTPHNPFGGAYESPPRIVMIYNNTEYSGVLDSYSFRVSDTLGDIPVFNDTVTSTIPDQAITVENGSVVRFVIKGNAPPEAQSDGLAVNAYTIEGKPVKVLKLVDESQKASFVVDLNEKRDYILMAFATWLPQEDTENISGYVSYSYKINVTSEV